MSNQLLGVTPNNWTTNIFFAFLHEPYMSLLCAWWKRYILLIFQCFSLFSTIKHMCKHAFKIHNILLYKYRALCAHSWLYKVIPFYLLLNILSYVNLLLASKNIIDGICICTYFACSVKIHLSALFIMH